MPNQDIKKLEENVIELRIEHARQSEQIVSMGEKVDEINEAVKGISKSLTQEVKASNKWLKSTVVRLAAILLMASIGGAGASAAIDAWAGEVAKPTNIVRVLGK